MINLRRNRTEDDEGLFIDGKPATYTRRSLYILSAIGVFLILVVIMPALIATRPRSVRGSNFTQENSSIVSPTLAPVAVASPVAAPQDVLSQSASVQIKVTPAPVKTPTMAPVVVDVSSPTSAAPVAQQTSESTNNGSSPTPQTPAAPTSQAKPVTQPTGQKPVADTAPGPSSVHKPPPTPAQPPQPKPSSVYKPPPTPAQPPQPKPSSVYKPQTAPAQPASQPVAKPAPTPKSPVSNNFDPLYINSGSEEKILWTENGKKKWVSDIQSSPRYHQYGQSKTNNKACERNEEDRLLCSERWYPVEGGYAIPAPKGKKYQIIMYFEEVIHEDPNFQRRFKIFVQDFMVRREYDIMEEAEGPNKLTTVKWVIEDLQQDEINIRFETIKGKDHAKISAVEIFKCQPSGCPK